MPTVARVQRTQTTAPIPGARLSATENATSAGVDLAETEAGVDRAAAGLGATVAGAGVTIARDQREAADRERERADQIAVLNASNVLSQWENQRLYDPNAGALTIKGKESFGLPEKVGDEFQTVAGQVEQSLGTDRQREAFQRVKLERQGQLDLTLRRHVYGEMQHYEASELQAFVENSKSAAIANAGDPQRIGAELDQAVAAIKTHAPRLGLGPEEIKHKIEATTSATHVGVIEQLLATDRSKAASVYYDETKGQISGESQARIQKALEEGSLRADSQKKADAIMAAGGTLTEQREKVRAIEDPKLRDQVEERVEHNAALKERADRETETQTLRGVYDAIDKTHDVASIPPAVWAGMDGGQRSAARSYAEHLTRGVAVETDFPTYYNLMQQAAHDPETFATQNLLNYRAKIGDTELKQLTELQGHIVNGARAQAEKVLGGYRTHEQIVDDSLSLYGIDPKAKATSAEGKAIAQLRRMLDVRVQTFENISGKKPTNVDVQSTIDQLLSTKVSVPGSWWNIWPGGQPFFAGEKNLIDLTIGDVPALDKQQITDALKRKGRPVSDETILDLFLERKARGLK